MSAESTVHSLKMLRVQKIFKILKCLKKKNTIFIYRIYNDKGNHVEVKGHQ